MEKLVVTGGTPLKGTVKISGAKNAAVAILPATVLVNGKCRIDNLPDISDIKLCCKILEYLGATVTYLSPNEVEIDSTNVHKTDVPFEMTKKFRASYYFIGSLLSRFGTANVGAPGGCNFGSRPIDQHIKGFEALGANVEVANGNITATTKKLKGTSIYMDVVSVGDIVDCYVKDINLEIGKVQLSFLEK